MLCVKGLETNSASYPDYPNCFNSPCWIIEDLLYRLAVSDNQQAFLQQVQSVNLYEIISSKLFQDVDAFMIGDNCWVQAVHVHVVSLRFFSMRLFLRGVVKMIVLPVINYPTGLSDCSGLSLELPVGE